MSANGNHFLYTAEDQFTPGQGEISAFTRDRDTGLLTYINDNAGTKELDGAEDVSVTPGGRYLNVVEGGSARKIHVVDTAVDRSLTLSTVSVAGTDLNLPGDVSITASRLQAIVSNNGPTDDHGIEVLFESSSNVNLTTENENCAVQSNGNVLCSVLNLPVGDRYSFDLIAAGSNTSETGIITATATSNKFDIDSSNDTDIANISVLTAPSDDEVESEVEVDNEGGGEDGGAVENESEVPPTNEGAGTPEVNDDNNPLTSTPASSNTESSGGCSILGARDSQDPTFLTLLLLCAGVYMRRKIQCREKTVRPAI